VRPVKSVRRARPSLLVGSGSPPPVAGPACSVRLCSFAGDRPDARPATAESFDADALDTDLDAVDDDTVLDQAPVQPNANSPVSMYDTGIGGGGAGGGTVGRLVEPDEGIGPDEEQDAIAFDAGAAGGGPTAEEAALHEIPER
jgi:hypothetical protein